VSTIQSVVLDLCRPKNHMLDIWVEELFDIDGTFQFQHIITKFKGITNLKEKLTTLLKYILCFNLNMN
jgi:hypothetical protein